MKKLLSKLIFSLCSILVCVGLVFTCTPKTITSTYAYTIGVLEENQTEQVAEIVLNDAANGKKYLYLYPNSNGISSIKDAFAYYVNAGGVGNYHDKGNQSSETELLHNLSYEIGHNDVIDSDDNGQFVSTISLSKNIILAMNAGFISNISASAQVVSTSSNSWNAKDAPETITMILAVYKENGDVGVESTPASQKTTEYASVSASLNNFAGQNYDKIALSFTSSFTSIKAGFINSTTGKNYMKIKLPTLEIVSTDKTKPTFSASAESSWTNEDRVVLVSATDNESGIYKIEYRKQGSSDWTLINDYAEGGNLKNSAETSFKVSQNGTYEIKVTDNVGNETISSFTESHIDKDSPNIKIDMAENFDSKTISFDASLLSSVLSAETYTFDYEALSLYGKDMTGSVSETGKPFVIGLNTLSVPENGVYNFKFNAYDEAGNIMQTIEIMNVSIDDRQVVTLEIEGLYIYTENGFTPKYEVSTTENINILFSYKNESETEDYASITSVGKYYVYFVIDDECFKGNGKQLIEILPKEVILTNPKTEYEYSGEIFELSFDISQDIELEYTIKKGEELAELKNAGEYSVIVSSVSENYVIVNAEFVVTVKKHTLVLQNIENVFEYDATSHEVKFDLDVAQEKTNIVVLYYDAANNLISSDNIVASGNYYVVFEYIGDTENYSFGEYSSIENALSLTISKRNLSVVASAFEIEYGEDLGSLSYSLIGELESEPLRIFELVLTKDGKEAEFNKSGKLDAGTYVAEVKIIDSLTEEQERLILNYSLNFVNSNIEVAKKSVQIIPNAKQSKVYGTEDSEILFSATGLILGDELKGSVSREQGENAGYYNITLGSLSNDNYNLKLSSEKFEITKRVCFIKVKKSQKTYGKADPEFVFETEKSNILPEDLALFNSSLFVRDAGENVGRYEVRFNENAFNELAVSKNYYVLSAPAKLEVVKANLIVRANKVQAIYGEEEKELTFTAENLDDYDLINIKLVREKGTNVGEYAISAVAVESENYDIEFIPSVYSILPREIQIVAKNSSKVYGQSDNLEFSVIGTDETLNIELSRIAGENVGTYLVNGYIFQNENYVVTEFVPAELAITKAKISVEIDTKTKKYGEKDEQLSCKITGLVFEDSLKVNLVREKGENVGEYLISLGENNFDNYEVASVTNASYIVVKAKVNFALENKTTIYSENQKAYIGKIESEFDESLFTYFYEDEVGNELEDAPVNAGLYKVYAKFVGTSNYEACVTEKVNLVIERRMISLTIKQLTFLYNGKGQGVQPENNLACKAGYIIKYTKDGEEVTDPIEVGDYTFTIKSNDSNYVCDYTNVMHIVAEFVSDNGDDASISTSSVSFSNANLDIVKSNESLLMKKFNTVFDGRTCIAVYEFAGSSKKETGDIFTVKIKAIDNKPVEIFAVDKNGNLTKVSYALVDGYYVLSVNSLASDLIVTRTNQILKYAKIIAMAVVLFLSMFITKTINRRRKNNFFARNTTIKKLDKNLVKENIGIVTSRIDYDDKVPVSEIINK